MVETVAKCEEVYVMLSGESLVPYRHLTVAPAFFSTRDLGSVFFPQAHHHVSELTNRTVPFLTPTTSQQEKLEPAHEDAR
eukprot:CAMPEP_0117624278 /NCGR_PEP_ID=MMETSP0802-20121206/289_1 /TAXON_ID=38833 /ORGANISM="Micromonas sp., Strain CCMP2099" /LENGTH=79 /DNA_ID=CAMNT_0005428295 /DNA_START=1 /DNA_END=238 /DNA_ORIENTATION=+